MNETELDELIRTLRGHEGPSVEQIHSWVETALANREAALETEFRTILNNAAWVSGSATLDFALAAGNQVRSLQRIPMADPNLFVFVNYQERTLSIEHRGAKRGDVLQDCVRFPELPLKEGSFRDALYQALRLKDARERIPALLAALPHTSDVSIQLSIVQAALRELRRLTHPEEKAQLLAEITQAEYTVLHRTDQWVRYGLLTETQQPGGIAYFDAESWIRAIRPGEQQSFSVSFQVVAEDHEWHPEAQEVSIAEIGNVDPFSQGAWREWLGQSSVSSIELRREKLLGLLD